jgi:RNA polymerase sigma-70 factor (ECF subfamily)
MGWPGSRFGKRIGAPAATTEDIKVQALSEGVPGPGAAARPSSDAASFERVYEEHFAFVWRNVLNRRIPHGSVDDVVQEVFIVVHRKLSTFEGRSSMRTWLAGIIRRVVSDHVHTRRNAPLGEPLGGSDELASPAKSPEVALDERTAARLLDELLVSMSETQREIFILHEVEQMTGREIAEVLSLNENTVHTRLRAARRIFQEGIARARAE